MTPSSRVSGLNWIEHWVARLEGPMTIALKAVAANAGPPKKTLRVLFEDSFMSHAGPGLLGLMKGRCVPVHELGYLIVSSTVGRRLPNLADLATQTRLRICTRCLDDGGLPYYLQFPAFARCPVHGAPVLESCPSCGRSTGGFRLMPEVMDVTMTCPGCRRPFSEAWAAASRHVDWNLDRSADAAHQQVHEALLALDRTYRSLAWGRIRPWFSNDGARALQAGLMACAAQLAGRSAPSGILPAPDPSKIVVSLLCPHPARWEVKTSKASLKQGRELAGLRYGIDQVIKRARRELFADDLHWATARWSPKAIDTDETQRLAWADRFAFVNWLEWLREVDSLISRNLQQRSREFCWYFGGSSRWKRPYFDETLPLSMKQWARVARWTLLCDIEAARRLYTPEHGLGEECRSWLHHVRRSQAEANGVYARSDMAAFALVDGRVAGTYLVCALPEWRCSQPAKRYRPAAVQYPWLNMRRPRVGVQSQLLDAICAL